MRLFYLTFLTTLTISLFPGISYCEIYKYTDKEEKIFFYEYTDENGASVFVDTLDAIPEKYRKKSKIIKKPLPELQIIESKPAGSEKNVGNKNIPKIPYEQNAIFDQITSFLNNFSRTISAKIKAPWAAEYISIF